VLFIIITYIITSIMACIIRGNITASIVGQYDLNRYGIKAKTVSMVAASDNFWSAFCVFHAHFWGKTHSCKICALKNAMIFDN